MRIIHGDLPIGVKETLLNRLGWAGIFRPTKYPYSPTTHPELVFISRKNMPKTCLKCLQMGSARWDVYTGHKTYRCNDRQLATKDDFDDMGKENVFDIILVGNVNANWIPSYENPKNVLLTITEFRMGSPFFVRKPKSRTWFSIELERLLFLTQIQTDLFKNQIRTILKF